MKLCNLYELRMSHTFPYRSATFQTQSSGEKTTLNTVVCYCRWHIAFTVPLSVPASEPHSILHTKFQLEIWTQHFSGIDSFVGRTICWLFALIKWIPTKATRTKRKRKIKMCLYVFFLLLNHTLHRTLPGFSSTVQSIPRWIKNISDMTMCKYFNLSIPFVILSFYLIYMNLESIQICILPSPSSSSSFSLNKLNSRSVLLPLWFLFSSSLSLHLYSHSLGRIHQCSFHQNEMNIHACSHLKTKSFWIIILFLFVGLFLLLLFIFGLLNDFIYLFLYKNNRT